jgi:GNAT superfamily N-acetyltransferase
VVVVLRIRNATATEAPLLEALQRRSSDVWEEYREQLAANPDAIELPQAFIDNGWVRVAVDVHEMPVGFSVVVPTNGFVHELDGLFVEPNQMSRGVGRALVEDAAAHASDQGAEALEITAGPAPASSPSGQPRADCCLAPCVRRSGRLDRLRGALG